MVDFFDALAARALGISPVLAPELPARFAEPGPGFGEVKLLGDAEPTGLRGSQPAAAAARNPKPARNPQFSDPIGRSVTMPLREAASPRGPDVAGREEYRPPPPRDRPAAAAPRSVVPSTPHVEPLGALETRRFGVPPGLRQPPVDEADGPTESPARHLELITSTLARPEPPRREPPRPEPVRPAAQDPESLQAGSRPERAPSARTPRLQETVARAQPPGTAHEFPAEEPSGARVTISIGHVEVRAINRTEAPAEGRRAVRAEPPRQPQPRLSLDDYLRGGRRR